MERIRVQTVENVNDLANAIIIKAVDDYRKAKINLKEIYKKQKMQELNSYEIRSKFHYERILNEVMFFFQSDWFCVLSQLDGNSILQRLESKEC